MANPQSEPTMDEILASIRRIISEEDDAPAAKGSGLEPLKLDESDAVSIGEDAIGTEEPESEAMAEAVAEAPQSDITDAVPQASEIPETASPAAEAPHTDPLDEIAPNKPEPEVTDKRTIDYDAISDRATKTATQSMAAQGLVSDQAARKVSEAFGALQENVRVTNASGQTIEDIVEAMLRPMIQEWLDRNLPRIVEEKVEEEVRRIARRR